VIGLFSFFSFFARTCPAWLSARANPRWSRCQPLSNRGLLSLRACCRLYFEERGTTAAVVLAHCRALAVMWANCFCRNADIAKIPSSANAACLSVDILATAASALAYNTSCATRGDAQLPALSQAQPQHSGLGPPAAGSLAAVDQPVEAPWAIPVQVRGAFLTLLE